MAVLEGESLFNDATSITLFEVQCPASSQHSDQHSAAVAVLHQTCLASFSMELPT